MNRWPKQERETPTWMIKKFYWGYASPGPSVGVQWGVGSATEYSLRHYMPSYWEFF